MHRLATAVHDPVHSFADATILCGRMKPIVLYGAGSQAYVLSDLLEANGYELVAVFNDGPPPPTFRTTVPLLGEPDRIDAWLSAAEHAHLHYAIAIGNQHGRARAVRHKLLSSKGLTPANLAHPTSFRSASAAIGGSCQFLAFSFLGVRARLGDAVILNSRASVDHECELGEGVHVAPGATLAGRVRVGPHTFIGAGAVILPDLHIAADVIVGAGAVVTHDIPDAGVYVGSPARRVR